MAFNPDLVGTWKPKSATVSFPTYRVDAAGHYFVAFPAQSIAFEDGGTKLVWGGTPYTKLYGTPGEIVGVWVAASGSEEWNFRADGTVTGHISATEEYFGNYELRDGNSKLWYEEFRSLVASVGARIEFDPPYAPDVSYDFSLVGPIWTLFDIATGAIVFEYEQLS